MFFCSSLFPKRRALGTEKIQTIRVFGSTCIFLIILSVTENPLEDVDDDLEAVRDRRDSTAGYVSYGFGVFGGNRSAYGWRRGDGDRRERGQTGDGSGGA